MSQLQLSWVQVKANEGSTQWQMLDLVLAQFDGIMVCCPACLLCAEGSLMPSTCLVPMPTQLWVCI